MRIVSSQDLRIATLSGAVVLLQAGAEKDVSNNIGAIALQMGAKLVDSEIETKKENINIVDQCFPSETHKEFLIPETTTDDVEAVVNVLQKLVETGNPSDFKINGEPKSAAITRELGRSVPSEVRELAWKKIIETIHL